MNAVITVVGKDRIGILAGVANKCFEHKGNVIDVTQKVIDSYFTMFMIVNIDELNIKFTEFVDELMSFGENRDLQIHVMHEDIFNLMHKV